jgi:peptidoglycan/LPS O-acetylase OafA/YrhL
VAYGVLVATLTFALAYATWHLIERHFLAFKPLLTTGSHPVGRAAA